MNDSDGVAGPGPGRACEPRRRPGPRTSPMATPPTTAQTKSSVTVARVTAPAVRKAAMAVRSVTRAVASLTSDSPSRIGHELPGQADPPGHGRGGDGVGGCDHGPEGEGHREGDGQQPPGERAHAQRGEEHEAHRQRPDDAPVLAEVHERGADRRGIQQRGQQAHQHDLRAQARLGDEGQVRARHARDDERQRRGDAEAPGQGRDDSDGAHHCEEGQGQVHGGNSRSKAGLCGSRRVLAGSGHGGAPAA